MTSNDSKEKTIQLNCKTWWCRKEPVRSERRMEKEKYMLLQ